VRFFARRQSQSSHPIEHSAPRLEEFLAYVGSGFHSNWLVVLRRTVGGEGRSASEYSAAVARARSVANEPQHAAFAINAQEAAMARAAPIIRSAMAEISAHSPGAGVTERARIETCEHFTRWGATAVALEQFLSTEDVEVLTDPFWGDEREAHWP
jgi:hypothetical protein